MIGGQRLTALPSTFVASLGLALQPLLSGIGFFFKVTGQSQQVPVDQSITAGWNARHSSQEFCLFAKLLNKDHVKVAPICLVEAGSYRLRYPLLGGS